MNLDAHLKLLPCRTTVLPRWPLNVMNGRLRSYFCDLLGLVDGDNSAVTHQPGRHGTLPAPRGLGLVVTVGHLPAIMELLMRLPREVGELQRAV